ncbi:hypothetical protein [Pantoea cypripedii]|uniref:Uncharacterized protein n=1 Tax=Pantoea cypripedii TaxID=55209 RepID=A0A1X1EGM8_PANCY|nr:hypothetical protein [Pantoea cypripedii]MBP2199769.1 hypothetical protein [Pantoea cypripedii]ORM87962.1 hypothetical protein HA50_28920 [Pantoea cypripedii]
MNSQITNPTLPLLPAGTAPVILWPTGFTSQITFVNQSPLHLSLSPNIHDSAEEYEKWRRDWIETNLQAVASKGTTLEQLIALQRMPGYQDSSLESLTHAVRLAGMKVTRDTVKLAQTAHRTNISDTQQKWFDASWRNVSGITKKERLASLLSQAGRPPIKAPELWLLLYNAGQRIGLTTVRNMLSAAKVNIEQSQIKLVNDTWNSLDHRQTTSIVTQLIRLLLLLENQTRLQPVEVLVALTEGDVDVNTTAMGHAAAAVRAKFTQADVEWIKLTWPGINRELPQFMQIMDLLNQYPQLDDITPGKIVRLLWEINAYVCPATIGNALSMVRQQRDNLIIIPDDPLPELIDLEPESPPAAEAKPVAPIRFQLPEQDELFPLQVQEWKWQLDQELDP